MIEWLRAILSKAVTGGRRPGAAQLASEIAIRRAAEYRLRALNDELERRVAERTASLEHANAELRSARAAADLSNAAKSDFLAAMSHEIRTPMNGVVGMLDLLKAGGFPADQEKFIDVARDSALSLLTVVNDILDHSRLEARALILEEAAFDPARTVGDVVQLLREGAERKGIRLELDPLDALPERLVGDAVRLRQVLLNLAGNAVKFTEAGEVRIRATHRSLPDGRQQLAVSVHDTGIGIPSAAVASVFGRFTQANPSTCRKYGGSGLGLAICRQLVTLMGGTIGFDTRPGEGSTFWFQVPLAVPVVPDAAAFRPAPAALTGSPRGLRILVAEDNAVNQMVIEAMLKRRGHAVTLVANGADAIAALERDRFDLVLMDIQMPGMDGVTATRRIRALGDALSRIPILALTANAMAGDREAFLAAGMNDYVSKPIISDALFAAIGRVLADEAPSRRTSAA